MKRLEVSIEIQGKEKWIGTIVGNHYEDARFQYASEYISDPSAKPISVSLPLQKDAFSALQTKTFFEALLPEGFSRRAVAGWANAAEEDYLQILEAIGGECLGALRIYKEEDKARWENDYEPLEEERVRELAAEGASSATELLVETHLSLTGASGKVGLYYDEPHQKWYLPKGAAPSTHIVKQSHVRLGQMVLNEQLCMKTAEKLGIQIPESFILCLGSEEDQDLLFATKRYDREYSDREQNGMRIPNRLHQEDFGQALGIPAGAKYEHFSGGGESYMKQMFELLARCSANPIEDRLRLWDRIVFDCMIGNTDCHVKNFSFLYSDDLKSMRLAPVYDIVCTGIYGVNRKMAFAIDGVTNLKELSEDSFCNAAKMIGISKRLAMEHYSFMKENWKKALEESAGELEQAGFTRAQELKDKIIAAGVADPL